MEIDLRGRVVSKYGSVAAFARAIGWSRRKARALLLGEQEMTLSDATVIADVLGATSAEDFTDLFLLGKYPHGGAKG